MYLISNDDLILICY